MLLNQDNRVKFSTILLPGLTSTNNAVSIKFSPHPNPASAHPECLCSAARSGSHDSYPAAHVHQLAALCSFTRILNLAYPVAQPGDTAGKPHSGALHLLAAGGLCALRAARDGREPVLPACTRFR